MNWCSCSNMAPASTATMSNSGATVDIAPTSGNIRGVNSFGRKGEEGDLLAIHPTVKPVTMVADAILDRAP
jgi:hypothetical protein